MRGIVRTIFVVAACLLFWFDCGIADSASVCNQINFTLKTVSKSGRKVSTGQLQKSGKLPNYIASIATISSANMDVLTQFMKKIQALGLPTSDAGYLALKYRDPQFIERLSEKQETIDRQLLDLMTRYGLPTPDKVGTDGTMSSFGVMANTFDPVYAAKFAKLWRSGCAKGVLPCAAYAVIEDNALMLRAGIQRFGTGTGVPFAKGTSLAQVNEERAKIKLGPLSQTCVDSIAKPGL